MNAYQYHEVVPSNDANEFVEMNSIDFELLAEGRKMLKNSITIKGDIVVERTAGTECDKSDFALVMMDNKVGFHGVCESMTCELPQSMGLIENVQDYPRYVASIVSATKDKNDVFNARDQAEGRHCTEAGGSLNCQATLAQRSNADTTVKEKNNFTIKPKICLNSMVGDDYSFAKNGAVRVSMNLARNRDVLFGGRVDSNGDSNYKLENVRLCYVSRPDDGKQGPINMSSTVGVKATANSQSSSIRVRVPASACSGVIANFIQQSNLNNVGRNSYKLEQHPQISKVSYLFNSSTNDYVSYSIDTRADMIAKGLEVLNKAGHNDANANKLASNQGFLIGLDFNNLLDLRNTPFQVDLESTQTDLNVKPRVVYLYFLNMISL